MPQYPNPPTISPPPIVVLFIAPYLTIPVLYFVVFLMNDHVKLVSLSIGDSGLVFELRLYAPSAVAFLVIKEGVRLLIRGFLGDTPQHWI